MVVVGGCVGDAMELGFECKLDDCKDREISWQFRMEASVSEHFC